MQAADESWLAYSGRRWLRQSILLYIRPELLHNPLVCIRLAFSTKTFPDITFMICTISIDAISRYAFFHHTKIWIRIRFHRKCFFQLTNCIISWSFGYSAEYLCTVPNGTPERADICSQLKPNSDFFFFISSTVMGSSPSSERITIYISNIVLHILLYIIPFIKYIFHISLYIIPFSPNMHPLFHL